MGVHEGSCAMGSFISLVKSGRFNEAKKGDWEVDANARRHKVQVRTRVSL